MTAALPMLVSTLFEMKKTISLRRRKPALIVFSLAILLLIPTATASEGWIKAYQGESMDVLTPTSIVQSSDGGFAVAVSGMLRRVDNVGYEGHFTTDFELQIMKVDSNGQIQWKHSYPQIDDPNDVNPPLSTASERYIIVQTADQGYAIASSTDYMGWLIKTDSQGAALWSKTYAYNEESPSDCRLYGMIQSNDKGFALAGMTSTSGGSKDFWLIKTDSKGNLQWQERYNSGNYETSGGQYPQDEEAKCIIQTRDGGFALAGSVLLYRASTSSFVSATWVVKTDAQGKLSWSKGYDLLNEAGLPQTIIQTIDNGYAIAGTENANFCLFKISSSGQMQWSKTYDDERTNILCSLVQLNDGGYALAGTVTVQVYTISLLRADSSGQTTWIKTFNAKQDSIITSNDIASAMILSSDGSYVLTGSTLTQSETHQDVLVIKTEKLEDPPTATPTVIPATTEPLNPDATLSPSATSTPEPNNTGYPDNSQTSNPNTENAFNSSTTWIGLAAGITVVVTLSLAIVLIIRSKKQKSS